MMNTILKFSLVSIGLAYSINGYSASFDCAKASSPFEKTICSNPNLSSLDEQLANVYKTAKESATNPDQLKTEQIAWIKATRNCGTDAGCIQQAYKARIVALSPQVKVAQSPPPAAPTPQVAPTPQPADNNSQVGQRAAQQINDSNPKPSSVSVSPPAVAQTKDVTADQMGMFNIQRAAQCAAYAESIDRLMYASGQKPNSKNEYSNKMSKLFKDSSNIYENEYNASTKMLRNDEIAFIQKGLLNNLLIRNQSYMGSACELWERDLNTNTNYLSRRKKVLGN